MVRPGGGGGDGDLSLFLPVSQCLSLVGCSPLSANSKCLLGKCGELGVQPFVHSTLLVNFTDLGLWVQLVPWDLTKRGALTVGDKGDLS